VSCTHATSHVTLGSELEMTISQHGQRSLPFGTFYGSVDVRHSTPGLEISVLSVDPHRVVERHTHDTAHFVFVLNGLYASSAAGAHPVSAGRALIFNPAGTTHRDRFESRARAPEGRFLTLSFDASLTDFSDSDIHVPKIANAEHAPSTLAIAERIVLACASSGRDASLVRESLALSLMIAVSREPTSRAGTAPAWLTTAREMLDDRCGENVRIAEVALAAGVHAVHLARVFRRYLGCSPGEYLRRRRIERSRVLLAESSRPISDVALSSGYVDQSHLTNAFRRELLMTPAAYRRLP
jgi:AraC family transcriptional regulator